MTTKKKKKIETKVRECEQPRRLGSTNETFLREGMEDGDGSWSGVHTRPESVTSLNNTAGHPELS